MLAPRIQRDEREPGVRRERASRSNQEPPAELVAEPRVRGFDGFDTLFQTRQGLAVIVHRCSGASGAERIACSCSSHDIKTASIEHHSGMNSRCRVNGSSTVEPHQHHSTQENFMGGISAIFGLNGFALTS